MTQHFQDRLRLRERFQEQERLYHLMTEEEKQIEDELAKKALDEIDLPSDSDFDGIDKT